MASRQSREDRLRVAEEAARIILEDGEPDYRIAKRKAAQRVSVVDERNMPNAHEIDEAIKRRQSLFGFEPAGEWKEAVSRAALELMEKFELYQPRLVGALAAGVLTPSTRIELHLFNDDAKSVAIDLLNGSVPYQPIDKEVGVKGETVPGFEFDWKGVSVELTIYGVRSVRHLPQDAQTGRSMKRVSYKDAKKLLQSI